MKIYRVKSGNISGKINERDESDIYLSEIQL